VYLSSQEYVSLTASIYSYTAVIPHLLQSAGTVAVVENMMLFTSVEENGWWLQWPHMNGLR